MRKYDIMMMKVQDTHLKNKDTEETNSRWEANIHIPLIRERKPAKN